MTGCCSGVLIDGAPAGGGGQAEVIYELDFSAQPDLTLTDGNHLIDGSTWTAAQAVAAATWAIENGVGLHYAGAVVGADTVMTSASQTATHLWIELSTLYARFGIDASTRLILEIYLSSMAFPSQGCFASIDLWGVAGSPVNGGDRLFGSRRGNNVVTQVLVNVSNASGSVNYTTDAAATNVVAILSTGALNTGSCAVALAGVWTGDWPPLDKQIFVGTTVGSPIRDRLSRLAISFPLNAGEAGMDVVVERLRLRRAA